MYLYPYLYSHFFADKAVSTFFTPLSQKEPDPITWRIVNNSLVVGKYNIAPDERRDSQKKRVAAFDLVRMLHPLYKQWLGPDG